MMQPEQINSRDGRVEELEQHVTDGRRIVRELVRKLQGAPGIDPMRAFLIEGAVEWLDDTEPRS